jgi:hypothetical protein
MPIEMSEIHEQTNKPSLIRDHSHEFPVFLDVDLVALSQTWSRYPDNRNSTLRSDTKLNCNSTGRNSPPGEYWEQRNAPEGRIVWGRTTWLSDLNIPLATPFSIGLPKLPPRPKSFLVQPSNIGLWQVPESPSPAPLTCGEADAPWRVVEYGGTHTKISHPSSRSGGRAPERLPTRPPR